MTGLWQEVENRNGRIAVFAQSIQSDGKFRKPKVTLSRSEKVGMRRGRFHFFYDGLCFFRSGSVSAAINKGVMDPGLVQFVRGRIEIGSEDLALRICWDQRVCMYCKLAEQFFSFTKAFISQTIPFENAKSNPIATLETALNYICKQGLISCALNSEIVRPSIRKANQGDVRKKTTENQCMVTFIGT